MRPRGMNHLLRVGTLCAGVVVVWGAGLSEVAHAQKGQPQPKAPPYLQQQPIDPLNPNRQPVVDPVRVRMDQERMKAMNDDRYKKLSADVDRLVSLTNELKTDVDKTNKDELSLDVIKKAQEIEKLAHDVQNRMKN